MMPGFNTDSLAITAQLVRLVLFLVPIGLLAAASLRQTGATSMMLGMGTAFEAVICFLYFIRIHFRRQPFGPALIAVYLTALAWIWWGAQQDDWFTNLAKATLLIVPLLAFAYQTLVDSGAPALRRARMLAGRLAGRRDWPADWAAIRSLPEVKALRAAMGSDPTPALILLDHARSEVRLAALAALEFRKDWRPGQAALVLQLAQRAEQPEIRAAAVMALANVEDRGLVETVAQFLHDASWEVRKAAIESLLWDTEKRWSWIRFAVRRILADPLFEADGPLVRDGQILAVEAVKDLTAWCAEKGALASRAAATLAAHYNRALTERVDDNLVKTLRRQLGDPHTPAVLRLEMGRILESHQELDYDLLEKLLDPAEPAPLRLIAAEAMLTDHAETPGRTVAIAALRDLARLPNREIALSTASVIQRRLGLDLGLGMGQPLPSIHSRQAAEITRRVMLWAAQYDLPEDVEDSRATPARIAD